MNDERGMENRNLLSFSSSAAALSVPRLIIMVDVDEIFELGGEGDELSLLETLDHVLDRGLVIAGEVTISVANIDLIYLGLNVLLGSVDTVNQVLGERARRMEQLTLKGAPAALADGESRSEEL